MHQFSDKDILTDCLKDAKWASTSYHAAVLESSTDQVRSTLLQMHSDLVSAAKSCFDLMHQRDWYTVEPARPTVQAQTHPPQQQPYQTGYQGSYQPNMGQMTYGAPANPNQPRW